MHNAPAQLASIVSAKESSTESKEWKILQQRFAAFWLDSFLEARLTEPVYWFLIFCLPYLT
jgi:hypothetical protein